MEQKQLRLLSEKTACLESELIQVCYTEIFDMLVVMSQKKEIEAVKLENEGTIWRLSGPFWKLPNVADGQIIKLNAHCSMKGAIITSDKRGNIYVADGVNNRILKVNGLTGEVLNILLLKKENEEVIDYLLWSDTEPNLIVVRRDVINFFFIPKSLP